MRRRWRQSPWRALRITQLGLSTQCRTQRFCVVFCSEESYGSCVIFFSLLDVCMLSFLFLGRQVLLYNLQLSQEINDFLFYLSVRCIFPVWESMWTVCSGFLKIYIHGWDWLIIFLSCRLSVKPHKIRRGYILFLYSVKTSVGLELFFLRMYLVTYW